MILNRSLILVLLVVVVCLHTNGFFMTVLADHHDGHSSMFTSRTSSSSTSVGSNNVVRIYTAINSNGSSSSNGNNETSTTTYNDPIESNNNVLRIYTAVNDSNSGTSNNNNISNTTSTTDLRDWNHTISCGDLSSTKNTNSNVQVVKIPFQFQVQSSTKVSKIDVRDFKTILLTDLSAEFLHNCNSKYLYEEIVGDVNTNQQQHFADYNGERVYSVSIDPLTGKQIVNIYDHNGNGQRRRHLDSASTTVSSSSVTNLLFHGFFTKQGNDKLVSEGSCSSSNAEKKEMFCSIYNSSIDVSLVLESDDEGINNSNNKGLLQAEAAVHHLILDSIEFFILRGVYNHGSVNSNIVSIDYLAMEEDESSDDVPENKNFRRVFLMGFGTGFGSFLGMAVVLILGMHCICILKQKRHNHDYPNNIEYGTSSGRYGKKNNDHEYDIEEQTRSDNHDEPKVNTRSCRSADDNDDIETQTKQTRRSKQQRKQQSVSFYNDLVSLPSAHKSSSCDDDDDVDIDGDDDEDNDDHSGRTSHCTDDDGEDNNDNGDSSNDNNGGSTASNDDHDKSGDRNLGVIDIIEDEEQPACSMLSSTNNSSEDDDYMNRSNSTTDIDITSSQAEQEKTSATNKQ